DESLPRPAAQETIISFSAQPVSGGESSFGFPAARLLGDLADQSEVRLAREARHLDPIQRLPGFIEESALHVAAAAVIEMPLEVNAFFDVEAALERVAAHPGDSRLRRGRRFDIVNSVPEHVG